MQKLSLEDGLREVRNTIRACVARTSLAPHMPELSKLFGSGKMLRARLAVQVGQACGTPIDVLAHAGAAIELIHGASLLHDDVIDGASLRRGADAFWVQRGTSGAVLLGDLFYCRAVHLIGQTAGGRLTSTFVEKVCEMCDAEAEQELLLRGVPATWEAGVSIARRKTGSLFAFVGYASAGDRAELRPALEASAYDVGTAYQVADDLLDVTGDPREAGKTLGTDASRAKVTAAAAVARGGAGATVPRDFIQESVRRASARLDAWPDVQRAWDDYVAQELQPAYDSFTSRFRIAQAV